MNKIGLFALMARLIAAVLALSAVALGIWQYTLSTRPPNISLPESHYDFGKVAEGVKVSHIFKVHNNGRKPLVIKEAKATCDCTTARLSKHTVTAGSVIDLEITMDTTMKQPSVSMMIETSSGKNLVYVPS